MKILDIAFTGYPVTDIKRARHFYEEVLGLTPSFLWGDETTAWIEYSIGSGTLAIGNVAPEWKSTSGGVCLSLEGEDIDAAVETLKKAGVTFHPPTETPVCFMLFLSDPDGNPLMLHKCKNPAPKSGCCCGDGCGCH